MKKRRPGLFACIGLDLLGHPRAAAAGEAMLTWFWSLLHSRKYELDGFISDEAVEGLPKPANNLAWARKLASDRVQLFSRIEEQKGWMVLRYEEWNDTAAEIAERRAETAARVAAHRSRKGNVEGNARDVGPVVVGNDGGNALHGPVRTAFVPVSDSASVSVDLPESAPRPRDRFAGSFIGPAWAAGVATATGGDPVSPTGGELDALVSLVYASPARREPGDDVEAWARAEGAAYGQASVAAGKSPTAWGYRDWVRNARRPIGPASGSQPVAAGRPRREIVLPPRPGSQGAA